MAYEKKEWHTGDIIDADGLNNIEEGISVLDEVIGSSSIDVVESDVAQLKDDMQIVEAHFPVAGKFVSGTGSAIANYAHAEGDGASASGSASHAEGSATEARGDYSHTEGYSTIADGESAHAEGDSTGAKGDASHASGEGTVANRKAQTVFGRYNVGEQTSAALAKQYGYYVEIVGNGADVGTRSNARTLDWSGNEELAGDLTINKGKTGEKRISTAIDLLNAHFPATGKLIAGELTSASGSDAVAVGRNTAATGHYSNTEGSGTTASGVASHAEGSATTANGDASHAEGTGTTATSAHSHAEGNGTQATGLSSHSEGSKTVASGSYSHAEGYNTIAKNSMQHVGGAYNIEDPSSVSSSEKGRYVEIIGNGTIAARSNARTLDWNGNEAIAGDLTINKGKTSEKTIGAAINALNDHFPATGQFVSGNGSTSADYAVAEGQETEARGEGSHAEGYLSIADGEAAHAEGYMAGAAGDYSHAAGECTVASRKGQNVFGRYNVAEQSSTALRKQYGTYVEIVGNGNEDDRSNARTLDWSGNEKLAGCLTLGMGTADEVTITPAQLKALLALLS